METYFNAVGSEKGNKLGKIIATTRNGKYKGLSKEQFIKAVKQANWYSFVIEELPITQRSIRSWA
jgi:hypothetical protein